MPVAKRYQIKGSTLYRDVRPLHIRVTDWFSDADNATGVFGFSVVLLGSSMLVPDFPRFEAWWDVFLILGVLYFRWLKKQGVTLPFKLPMYARDNKPKLEDANNKGPAGKNRLEGILLLGNERKTKEEIWVTANDAKTHILYLGTTGAGKSEGLKALATNTLSWGSGFTYVDGKADTSVWGGLYALARRFGRDDDVLVINYMTANSDNGSTSNTMNPFSNGSASYLVQMLTNLMSDSGGDNAMWKERAVALIGSLMPALTYMRDNMGYLLDIGGVREHIELKPIIKLSRRKDLPERIVRGVKSYLETLPGYVDDAFDDEGNEKPPSPDSPVYDLSVARQQHGYLSMQFTRSLQSLADEYGYIFKSQLADVDVVDLVLNRRILVVLIPALEKSKDETANLGKIVAASLKGMMGAALGAQLEGGWEMAIENKMTNAPSPYMVIFDEVGYYVTEGMAVMAAQARSLGFSLVFAAQDLPAMEKRVKEEARSITGNCNIKIFGKLEDPTGTKEFFEKSVGSVSVMSASGMQTKAESFTNQYNDNMSASKQSVSHASYDDLKEQREGQSNILLADMHVTANNLYVDTGKAKALRVQHLVGVPAFTSQTAGREKVVADLARSYNEAGWTAANAQPPVEAEGELAALLSAFKQAKKVAKAEPAAQAAVGSLQNYSAAAAPAAASAEAAPAANQATAATTAAPAATTAATKGATTPSASKVTAVSSSATVQATTDRRAPVTAVATPSERDVVKSAAAKPKEVIAPFGLPAPDTALAQKLRSISGKIASHLFAEKSKKEAAE